MPVCESSIALLQCCLRIRRGPLCVCVCVIALDGIQCVSSGLIPRLRRVPTVRIHSLFMCSSWVCGAIGSDCV